MFDTIITQTYSSLLPTTLNILNQWFSRPLYKIGIIINIPILVGMIHLLSGRATMLSKRTACTALFLNTEIGIYITQYCHSVILEPRIAPNPSHNLDHFPQLQYIAEKIVILKTPATPASYIDASSHPGYSTSVSAPC